ncbi:E3 ubiquitin-protein ligase UBR2 isoform X2 [Ischnura elegans]|uniref:E3 ubiquitin-protein ligase UBR2 isoform X2 n=1 Tax=Ischnura elegans TaxID=197161 RepID=UPI001ED8B215|nr:E3 ubiquitin-protein ligase UBR2 isoform X2 [Ischnura elegans]
MILYLQCVFVCIIFISPFYRGFKKWYIHHRLKAMEDNRQVSPSVTRTGSMGGRKGGSLSSGSRALHSSISGEDLLHLHPHPLPGTRAGSSAEYPVPSADAWLEAWREKFEQGTLTAAHFREQWRIWVPKVYGPRIVAKRRSGGSESSAADESGLEWSGDEEEAQKMLYEPFERFICGGEPEEVLQKLKEKEGPRQVCGRVFRSGEPTYSCRECGLDSTCVLCVHCFKASPHRHHKYKMGTSCGGGCCDCGDLEAWKSEPYCADHNPRLNQADGQGNEEENNSNSMEEGGENQEEGACAMLAPDIERRAKFAFSAALQYAFHLLTLEHAPGLPSDLRRRDCCQEAEGLSNDGSEGSPENSDGGDLYCTVLYNDETHTFEQVISTVQRVVKCPHREAIQFVTAIDLEGRAIVQCAKFSVCSGERSEIERFTSRHGGHPLKVLVMHAHVVAHQTFALRLLARMRSLLSQSRVLRSVFSKVVHQTDSTELSILEGILRRDCFLWKSARSHWHYLFITGMLMEYSSKKLFAQVFTKHYGNVLKDFIRDDHEHSFSVASLSVQIYTVPSLARSLIAHSDALYPLINTFLSECAPKCNREGKLEFERNAPNATFKRAQYILYDLRYLLTSVPTTWTDALRKGFLQGFSLLLSLLTMLQGMDAVTRQTGQHMEYEPDWESAFNLHLKLAHVVALVIDWCSTDRVVLIKAYRATLKKLQESQNVGGSQTGEGDNKGVVMVGEAVEVGEHSAACIKYDVSSKPVSVHLPLSRLLAGLHLHLHKHGLSFDSPEFHPDRFVLHSKPTPVEIMEPVLRCQVMIAQVHAGMWRRNGYALLSQLYFYHNVKCRSEMLDRDIVLLQMAASLLESNEFIIHLLNRFNLVSWANPEFELTSQRNPEEDSTRQTISLVEEMLGLLVTICGERWTVGVGEGVTPRSVVRREVVQQLCVRPMAHSELGRALPSEDGGSCSLEPSTSCLDDVLSEVAVFKPASGAGRNPADNSGVSSARGDRGVYELRPELADEYDVFFYHYTREEMSRSEEVQRKRRKGKGQLECCPPPAPPALSPPFAMLANLLQCDLMLHIMATVLQRSADLRARSFSETQLHKTLHLIGYALHEEERSRKRAKEAEAKCALGEDTMSEVGDAVAGFFCFTERAEKVGIPKLIEKLVGSQRVEAHRDMLLWTIGKFKQVAALRNVSSPESSSSSSQAEGSESSREVVLKRREGEDEASKKEEKERRTKMAAMKRAKVMEQMMAMQRSFLAENAQLFEATITDMEKAGADADMELADESETSFVGNPIAFGPQQTPPVGFQKRYTCILCQEEEDVVTGSDRALVLSAFVQRSTVLCLEREHVPRSLSEHTAMQLNRELACSSPPSILTSSITWLKRKSNLEKAGGKEDTVESKGTRVSKGENPGTSTNADDGEEEVDLGGLCLGWNLGPAPHTSTCGHVMHAYCWQKYYNSVLLRENRRPYRLRQPASFDVENKEFLCPLCECLSNTVLPLVPTVPRSSKVNSKQVPTEDSLPFGVWVRGIQYTVDQAKEDDGWTRESPPRSDITMGPTSLPARRSSSRIPVPSNSSLASSPTQRETSGPAGAAIRRHRVSHSSGSSSSSHVSTGANTVDVHLCPISKVIEELGIMYGPTYATLFQHSEEQNDDDKTAQGVFIPLSMTLCEMFLLFCQTTFEKGMDSEPELGGEMTPLLPWQSTAYTIHALEWLLRSSESAQSTPRSLLGHLSSRQRDCLRGLVQLASSIESNWRKPLVLSSHALRLLHLLLPEEFIPEGQESKNQECQRSSACLLDWDSFGLLVPLLMSLGGMYQTSETVYVMEPVNGSSLRDLYVLRLVLLSHIIKIVLTADFESLREEPMEVDGAAAAAKSSCGPSWGDEANLYAGAEGFQTLAASVRDAAGLDPSPILDVNPRVLWRKVANDSMAFLRCSALLAHFLSGVAPSSALETPGGATFHALCDYLGLSPSHNSPTCPASLGLDGSCDVSKQLALGWSRNRRLKRLLQQNVSKPLDQRKGPASIRQPLGVNQLVTLPEDYSELINKASLFACPNSDREDSRNPTLCLVCGEILCSQSYCCQMHINKMLVGACNYHAHHCGAGVGLFLRVRECEVLIISTPVKGCLLLAPYLDRYGESDPGLRRGNPLWLCHERYAKLHALWLSHALPEEVARALDASSSPTAPNTSPTHHLLMTMQWQYL